MDSESEGFGVSFQELLHGQNRDIFAEELDIHFMSDKSRKMDDSDEDFDGEQQF